MKKKKWYQKISNWLFIVAILILLPILITNFYIMFQANNEKDKVPNIFGYKPFIVLSGSMETEIRVGDLIITKMTDPKTLKKDDVIAFRDHANTVTTHRIIDIIEQDGTKYFITKGDNNDSQDENLVELEDVEGIYITRIPGFGNIFNELSKPTTIIILVLGITVIFILLFQISNKKLKDQEHKEYLEYKKKQKEKKETPKQKENTKNTKEEKEYQEFLEYKKMKEEKQKQKENQEFQEYKRMKEEKQKNQDRKEFLEYKRVPEEKKNSSNQKQFSKNNQPKKKYNKNAKYNDVKKHGKGNNYNKRKNYSQNKNTSK